MIPDPNAPPLRQALAVLFNHPELLTLDPSRARPVQELIAGRQNPHFADVWQFISAHPLRSGDPWAEFVPIADVNGNEAHDNDGKTLYQWALTPGMCSVIRQPLATALQLVRTARPIAPPGGGQRLEGADRSWTIVDVPSRFGLVMPSVSFDSGNSTCALQVRNTYPRHVSVYVEFFAAGQPVAPTTWTSRLPPAAQDFLETGTVKYLTTLPPTCPVAGMPVPAAGTSLSFSLPEPATAARVMFGGTGLGDLNLLVDAAGVVLTAVLDHAVPLIMDGATAGLAHSAWFHDVLADGTVTAEIMAAARFLFQGPPAADMPTLLQSVGTNLGTLLLGGALPKLIASIADTIGPDAVANCAPVLGWGETEMAAQAVQRLQAQSSTRVLSCPATFWLDLLPASCRIVPDPRHGMWPDEAAHYQVDLTYSGAHLSTAGGAVPQASDSPIDVLFPALPAGGRSSLTASVMSASGRVLGQAEGPAAFVSLADQVALPFVLALEEGLVSITSSTQYRHVRKLTYDPVAKVHQWKEGPAPTTVGLVPAEGASFRALVGITLQEVSGDVGYVWQAGDATGQYCFQSVGVIDPEARFRSSGALYTVQPYLVYDQLGAGGPAATGTGWNFYLDPDTYASDGDYHLRGVALDDGMPFNLDQTSSWGAFAGLPTSLRVHPAGLVIACRQEESTVEILWLPAAALATGDAPTAAFILGPGSGTGAVGGPVAAAVTSTGVVLVLEQDNARVQAIDAFGNAVPYFPGPSPCMRLNPETGPARYLDLAAGPADTIYVLLSRGSSPGPDDYCLDLYRPDGTFLSRTTGVPAAHLAVDAWGRAYTLNHESFAGPEARAEPSISQWLPEAL